MNDLLQSNNDSQGRPVECLGVKFPNDADRRAYFLKLLAEKLRNPQFRNIEGFPVGSDEAILELSDPPYYTACPNPFVQEFIALHGTPYDPGAPYLKEPFSADVSEGKYDPLYKLHPYHTKVPHKAIMRYILHYTQPGALIFDGFCGTGMTGVAAQLCGNVDAIEELGYKVDGSGIIYEKLPDGESAQWLPFSKLGQRFALLNDLSPAATFISYKHNAALDLNTFERTSGRILTKVAQQCGWMYQTLHRPTERQIADAVDVIARSATPDLTTVGPTGQINYVVWSDLFSCPQCSGEINFWRDAVDVSAGKVKEEFLCPHCSKSLAKRDLTRLWRDRTDVVTGLIVKQAKLAPVKISYSVGSHRYEKKPDRADFALISMIEETISNQWMPTDELPDGFNTRQPKESHGITRLHHFYTGRCARLLASYKENCETSDDLFLLTRVAAQVTIRYRYTYQSGTWGAGGGPMSGTLYIPSLIKELNPLEQLRQAGKDQKKRLSHTRKPISALTGTSSSTQLPNMPSESVDYIFLDPPFGSNIMYSDLNLLWEGWLRVFTNIKHEAIENSVQKKSLDDYRLLMRRCFAEAFRVLKPGRWMTVEFSNTQASVWNAIQTALQEAGFVVANVASLDKQKASFKATTTTTAVKQDLVISAYKPNGGLEERFARAGSCEDSAWDFVRTHLKYLPTVKIKGDNLEFIAERDPRIIFDRMVAWFIRHESPVPISSHEFQEGLRQRFPERDGMVFMSDQVAEYDGKRAQVGQAPQMEMFVSDERSAIDWLTDFLRARPSTYQELSPEFIGQLGAGWKKHEMRPELSALLEDNFLRYDGTGDVPSQIHSYLSTNHKTLRGLGKSDTTLKAKAKDRWYVPDPGKVQDLEQKREKALLREFETYHAAPGRRLKEFRLEVLRAGFKAAWVAKNYKTIIAIARKIPEEALQEDEKLLLWYDQALTRMEADA
jgi:DNA modification methylase